LAPAAYGAEDGEYGDYWVSRYIVRERAGPVGASFERLSHG
jgi:hypothetical protein